MEDDSGTGLPASLEAAWGLRGRPPKGPKRSLSLTQIVDAAIRIAGSDGLAAVSMSRVAAELGAAPMSLYRYVAAKDELLTLMSDAAYGPPPVIRSSGDDWRTGLSRWAWAERAALLRHPWVLQMPISGPPATPYQLAWLEAGLQCLDGSGLDEVEKLSSMLLLAGFVRHATTQAADIETAAQDTSATLADVMVSYTQLLRKLVDAQRFPALTKALDANAFDDGDGDGDGDGMEDQFIFGLERVLDGIETLIQTRRPTEAVAPPREAVRRHSEDQAGADSAVDPRAG